MYTPNGREGKYFISLILICISSILLVAAIIAQKHGSIALTVFIPVAIWFAIETKFQGKVNKKPPS